MPERESYISQNGDYTGLRQDNALVVFWSERPLWSAALTELDFIVAGLGNNGMLLVKRRNALIRYMQDNTVLPVESARIFERRENAPSMQKVTIDSLGQTVILETVEQEVSREKKKFISFSKTASSERIINIHRIISFDLESEERHELWRFDRESSTYGSFLWDITKDGKLLAVAGTAPQEEDPRIFLTRIYLLNVAEDKSLFQINLSNVQARSLKINNEGEVLLHIVDGTRNEYIVIDKRGEKSFVTSPMGESRPLYFGKDLIVLELIPSRLLMFKSFDDKLVYIVDQVMYEALGFLYPAMFKANDEMVFATVDRERYLLKRFFYSWRVNQLQDIYHK
ncbi:MAG: hypothetical protein RDV48_22805 [Candidatus Eremiobacteraeota bacterium]|nr:hypothetical protein [Candidatus Eremiobacteraeota bacterium]